MRSFVLTLWLLLPSLALAAAPPPPWQSPSFSAPAAAVVKAAQALPTPAGASRQILVAEHHFRIEADGTVEQRARTVYRILTAVAVTSGDNLAADWDPWYQERPQLRARVITRDGVEHALDPGTVVEAMPSANISAYSDHRQLRAPLPALAVGAVVETETVTRDRVPFVAGGKFYATPLAYSWPAERITVVLDAPAGQPLHWAVRDRPPVTPERQEADGRVRLQLTLGPIEALGHGHENAAPRLAFTIARSWDDVAAAYARIAEQQLLRADRAELDRTAHAALAGVAKDDVHATVAALAAFVHREVRYTGVWLGDASMVPRTPSETLQRRYGDCKDRSLLLLALLRSAGVRAQLALLRAESGLDVDDALPSVAQFDHTIVYVPGAHPLWVDPGADPLDVDVLPAPDAGRRALVAAVDTHGLRTTPAAPPDRVRLVLDREVRLAEAGPAQAFERLRIYGQAARLLRLTLLSIDRKKLIEDATRAIQRRWEPRGPVQFNISDPEKLDEPVTLSEQLVSDREGSTVGGEAVAALADDLVSDIPPSQVEAPELDLHVHLVVPAGYSCAQLAKLGDVTLSGARLVRHFTVDDGGMVNVDMRYEPLARGEKLTMSQLMAAAHEAQEKQALRVSCPLVAQRERAAGHLQAAVAELQRLATLHPQEALHHGQLAELLLQARLGQAARDEARRGVALEPDSAAAHRVLGIVLAHDLFGRKLQPGCDRAGATAELERALALDGSDVVAVERLVELYETNDDGDTVGPGAPVDKAVAILRAHPLAQRRPHEAFDRELGYALAYAHRWRDLTELTAAQNSPDATLMRLTATAALDGAPAALGRIDQLPAEQRPFLIKEVANLLMWTGQLTPAAAFYDRAAREPSITESWVKVRADLLRRLPPRPPLVDEHDPASVVRHFDAAMFSGDEPGVPARIRPLFTSDHGPSARSIEELTRSRHSWTHGSELPLPLVAAAFASATIEKDGDDHIGYRLRRSVPTSSERPVFYVVREGGRYRGLTFGGDLAPLGRRALRFVDAGDTAAATRLLEWAAESMRHPDDHDPLAQPPFLRVWESSSDGPAPVLRLAAALLLVNGAPDDAKLALELLTAARSAPPPSVPADAIDAGLVFAHMARREWSEALAVAERLAEQHPRSTTLFLLRGRLLHQLQCDDDRRRLIDARLAALPDDPAALRSAGTAAGEQGRWAEAERPLRRLVERGKALAPDFNELAWQALFRPPVGEQAASDALRSVQLSQRHFYGELHTLASIEAELGRVVEAAATLGEALEAAGTPPRPGDHYVLGRIAEQLGLRDVARAEYRQVQEADAKSPVSTQRLAESRLRALGQP